MISYFQAIIIGLLQGVTELFPISSLGHSVLVADLFGWHNILKQQTAKESDYLTFLVMLHVATAIALIIFYRAQWVRIVRGFIRSLKSKSIDGDSDAKLAWLLAAATVPAGIFGLVFEHPLRTMFAKPIFAIIFIMINGVILIKGDKLVRVSQISRPRQRKQVADADELMAVKTSQVVSDHLTFGKALFIGVAQTSALFAGISRSGITMIAGLRTGLNHQDAARFSFLLATPIILAAGMYKLPHVVHDTAIRNQALVGAVVAGIAAYLTVRYLDKYFRTRSLRPFGYYCIGFGVFMLLLTIVRGPQG